MVAVRRSAERGPDIGLVGEFFVQIGVGVQTHRDQRPHPQPGTDCAYEIGLAAEDVLDR